MADRYADPKDELNSAAYHTGKPCVILGCSEPAGTAWSPYFCQLHNAERMERIGRQLEGLVQPSIVAP